MIFLKPEMEKTKLCSITPQEISKSFTILRQDTGSTGTKIIRHTRQHSDRAGRSKSFENLKRSLSGVIKMHKSSTIKFNSKVQVNKTHRKSHNSLNISKMSDRNQSKR